MPNADLDPRTPVLVGVGQASERITHPDYQARSAVELAADAVRQACTDTGADASAVAAAIDTVAGIRQVDNSLPGMPSPLGRTDNYPRSVASRVGADPRRALLDVAGGQSAQHLVTEFARTIAAGGADTVLIVGSEITSTTRHLAGRDDKPDFTEHVGGQLEDRGHGLEGIVTRYGTDHGLAGAPNTYALLENARRARLGLSPQEYAQAIGELFAPFTRVAAKNPHAAAPVERTASELVTVTEANRRIAEPYTRYVVARDQVNLGAAVLITSVAAAQRLGIPRDKWVFLHGHADVRERDLLDREDLSLAPAFTLASRHALDVAGIGVDDIDFFDFYSCFPIAVFAPAVDGLGLTADDPRGLTLTGGLPFFGGPGSSYSLHAIAEVVHRLRDKPGSYGFIGANGGVLSKYSTGVYSTLPTPWRPADSASLQARIDALPAPGWEKSANGWATIEAYTVKYDRAGTPTGVVVGRLELNSHRFLAMVLPDDAEMLALLATDQPIGERVFARSTARGNRVTTSAARMDVLLPRRRPALRGSYENVLVRRDGHILEITINRPGQRNALPPPASEELASIFDAFFADRDLWVAIITGAGHESFCAGMDLAWAAQRKPLWTPETGFAGLTSRRGMDKPVIAAINGDAMGGGFEITLACHLVVADESARFALSEVKVGLVAGAGGAIRLPRTVPPKVALELILTGRMMTAGEAAHYGLVNRVVPTGSALDGARALAQEIVAVSPTSVRMSLRLMSEAQSLSDPLDAIHSPSAAVEELILSEDCIEGVAAFAEKRTPNWKNR